MESLQILYRHFTLTVGLKVNWAYHFNPRVRIYDNYLFFSGAGIPAVSYDPPLEVTLQHTNSFSHFNVDTADLDKQVEYYFASDASAVIEYTNKVIFLEDDDVAAITADGCKSDCFSMLRIISLLVSILALSIHHVRQSRAVAAEREVHTLKLQLQEIMKGSLFS